MPEDRLRFRCYRCNQLLGVPRKKAGTVISCPRCGVELAVPRGEPEPAPSGVTLPRPGAAPQPCSRGSWAGAPFPASPPAQSGSLPLFMEEIAAAIPEDLAALRPEDIRVEAEFVDLVVTTGEPTPLSPGPLAPAVEPEPSQPSGGSPPTGAVPTAAQEASQGVPVLPIEQPLADPGIGAILPAITIEPPSILPPGREIRPVREVVLQPGVVLAWSLLVLLSLPAAFVAGLLIGHFLWKSP